MSAKAWPSLVRRPRHHRHRHHHQYYHQCVGKSDESRTSGDASRGTLPLPAATSATTTAALLLSKQQADWAAAEEAALGPTAKWLMLPAGERRYHVLAAVVGSQQLRLLLLADGLQAYTAAVVSVRPSSSSRPPRVCPRLFSGVPRSRASDRKLSGIFGAQTRASRPLLPCKQMHVYIYTTVVYEVRSGGKCIIEAFIVFKWYCAAAVCVVLYYQYVDLSFCRRFTYCTVASCNCRKLPPTFINDLVVQSPPLLLGFVYNVITTLGQ